jgi:hypothetical protein
MSLSVSGSLMAAIVVALGFMNGVAPPREAQGPPNGHRRPTRG